MPSNTTVPNPGTNLGYQNPQTTNSVLDSETTGLDPATGIQVVKEFVIPQGSISSNDPLTTLCDLMAQCLVEIRKIRIIVEQDTPPGFADSVIDEAMETSGAEDENTDAEGIDDE